MRSYRPAAVLLFLALTLGASGAFAAPRMTASLTPPRAAERGNLLVQVKAFLVNLWSAEGCRLDPLGGCLPDSKAGVKRVPTGDEGCRLDPWGGCGTSNAAGTPRLPASGCRIDPLGGCNP